VCVCVCVCVCVRERERERERGNSRADLEQSLGHWSKPRSWIELIQVNARVKMIIIIIIFKPDSWVNLKQGSVHEWG
jgi:hypothetical protein